MLSLTPLAAVPTSFVVPCKVPSALAPLSPHHENDERIVQLARLLHRVKQTADVIIGMRQSARVDFHHPREQALLVCRQRIPRRKLFRALSQLGVRRNDTELDLPSECLFADLVPALVKL